MKLTKKQFKEFKGYVEYYKQLFGMTSHQLHVSFKTLDRDVYAECTTSDTWISITLNKEVSTIAEPALDLKKTALHEILHSVMDDYMNNYFNIRDRLSIEEQLVNKFVIAILGEKTYESIE